MVSLPQTGHNTLVIRTDFTDSAGWQAAREAILAPGAQARLFTAHVEFVDDPDFADWTPEQVLALVTDEFTSRNPCLFIVDKTTVSAVGWPVLVMDLYAGEGQVFRAVAESIHGIEANLSTGNMDFAEYAEAAEDADGVFRGFGGPSRAEILARLQEAAQTGKSPNKFMEAMLRPQPDPPAQ
jgi:hypothetical protein